MIEVPDEKQQPLWRECRWLVLKHSCRKAVIFRKPDIFPAVCVIGGKWAQRDLYSAFLIMNSDAEMEHADRALCRDTYDNFLILHDQCIEELKSGSRELLSSFGISRAA